MLRPPVPRAPPQPLLASVWGPGRTQGSRPEAERFLPVATSSKFKPGRVHDPAHIGSTRWPRPVPGFPGCPVFWHGISGSVRGAVWCPEAAKELMLLNSPGWSR